MSQQIGSQTINSQHLPEVLLFGFAKPYVYMIRGKTINGVYHLALEVTDHTDQGTYASAFPLDSLISYWGDELDISPSDPAMTLQWLKSAFDDNNPRNQNWIPADDASGRASPLVTAKYQPIPDDETSKETLSLPPKKFPLLGPLNPKLASEVRASITTAAIQLKFLTQAKLAECEKQKKKLDVAVEAVRELRADGDSRLEQVMAMMRKLNNGEAVEEDEEGEGKDGGAMETPLSTEKPLRAATQPGVAGAARRPPPRRMSQSRFATGNAGKARGGKKVLGAVRK